MQNIIAAAAAALLTATSALAQTSVGNPPGNTLAPATTTTASAAISIVLAPDITPAQLAAVKYKTEIVCKTSVETGSLIAKRKTCLTRKQWEYVNNENQRAAYKIVSEGTGRAASE